MTFLLVSHIIRPRIQFKQYLYEFSVYSVLNDWNDQDQSNDYQ